MGRLLTQFRQGHKTGSNDALAVAEAARRPNIKEAPMKTAEQQGLQAIQRARELLIGERTALSVYAAMGSGKAFSKGRELSADLGLTPRQYSSGGKTNVVGIS